MNVDRILDTFNRHEVDYLLIGGMNFLLRHAPVLTYDVDLWIDDTPENLARCEKALVDLGAEWGPSEKHWGPVARRESGWLGEQMVFCMMSPHGAIDVFRAVKGLASWRECRARASVANTPTGVPFPALADSENPPVTRLPDDELKRREEEKRERCWDPVERWRVLQETITWAEATVRRNTPARCLELQRAKLAPPPLSRPGSLL